MSRVTVRIDNAYSDGHESTHTVELDAPTGDLDEWFAEVVYEHTGDGHGVGGLGSCYTATITAAADPALIGRAYEWCD